MAQVNIVGSALQGKVRKRISKAAHVVGHCGKSIREGGGAVRWPGSELCGLQKVLGFCVRV